MSWGGGMPLRSFIMRLWCCQARLRCMSCFSSALISTDRDDGYPSLARTSFSKRGLRLSGCSGSSARRSSRVSLRLALRIS
ncbi:hypothetical protein D3C76_1794890 [compost metagenome]